LPQSRHPFLPAAHSTRLTQSDPFELKKKKKNFKFQNLKIKKEEEEAENLQQPVRKEKRKL
jgi:hypothetical protein